MRNLIVLFLRFGGIILFIVLEIICMFLVVEFNQKHSDIYTTSSNRWTGAIYNKADDVAQYLRLSAINDSLAAENARLYAQLDNAKYLNTLQVDSIYNESFQQKYTFIAAKVINNSYTKHNNTLTLDKGRRHGIRERMGVVSNFGVVGMVTSVSDNYSVVLSMLHRQSRISASIQGNNYQGGIVWTSSDPTTVKLVDIPKHANFELRDTVQTSGYSSYFPAGITIGTIQKFDLESGSNFYDIDVKLSNDLSNIQYVYVVNNLQQTEQLELEEEVIE
ncbi:MAG: rod shape-determining protein MreC [Bacteroidota bacterium]